MKLRIILFWPCVRSLFIGWQHGMARPLPVFGFCQPSAKCLRMICEKKPTVVGAGLREELWHVRKVREPREWAEIMRDRMKNSWGHHITPQQTTEFTRLITAAHRNVKLYLYIYTECRPKLIRLFYLIFTYEQITYWERSVLVESWVQLIWCRDFRARVFCLGRNGWLL